MSLKTFLRCCLWAVFVLFLLAWPSRTAQAQESTLSLDEYWRKLEQTRASVAELQEASSDASREQLSAWAKEWEQVTGVILPDGAHVPLDHSRLLAELRSDPPDLDRLEELLNALLAARDTWPSSERSPADLQSLERILSGSQFQWEPAKESQLAKWWRQFWEGVAKFLDRLLPESGPGVGGDLFVRALTILGIVALGAVLAYVLRDFLAEWVAETEIDPDAGVKDEDLTASTALKRAQTLSSEGDYRSAVRYLYLSSLLLLEERGLLRYDRSLTNREYLRSVAHLPQLAATLRDVVEVFDRVWYGYQPLNDADYARYAERVAELRRLQ